MIHLCIQGVAKWAQTPLTRWRLNVGDSEKPADTWGSRKPLWPGGYCLEIFMINETSRTSKGIEAAKRAEHWFGRPKMANFILTKEKNYNKSLPNWQDPGIFFFFFFAIHLCRKIWQWEASTYTSLAQSTIEAWSILRRRPGYIIIWPPVTSNSSYSHSYPRMLHCLLSFDDHDMPCKRKLSVWFKIKVHRPRCRMEGRRWESALSGYFLVVRILVMDLQTALLASAAYLSSAKASQLSKSISLMSPMLETLPPLAQSVPILPPTI